MLRRKGLLTVLLAGVLLVSPQLAPAQSVDSIVDNMEANYKQQLETVETYIVKTNLYTSYNRKVTRDGEPTYETQMEMTGSSDSPYATSTTPTTAAGMQFDRLRQHATYTGSETVNGAQAHVLSIDDPSKVSPEIGQGNAESLTYFIDANTYVPVRFLVESNQQGGRNAQDVQVTINMRDYRTTDGLTLPYRMEFIVNMNMSEQQRQQMQQAMKQMENMPEQQRKRMEQMMGNQMEMMKRMMSGEPVVVEVQSVEVNTELPDGIFAD